MEQRKGRDLQKELEIALSELEDRVDRLRASYEQYFLGFEKLEPSVQRKDVDRRFTDLRKTQIRNTAQRFRFNVVTQKFNTYAMYWTRICRQIEEGTFKRHLVKAAKRFGGPAEKRVADDSIEVELGDFEADIDMDAVLAEANAAADAYGRSGQISDTVPPGAKSDPPLPQRAPASQRNPLEAMQTPRTSFAAVGSSRETLGSSPDSERTPAPGTGPRAARHAALPPGAKPRVLLRRREGEATPGSSPSISVRAPMGSSPGIHAGPPSSSMIRPSPASGSAEPSRPAPGSADASRPGPAPSRPGPSPSATSVDRLPVGAPSSPASAGAASSSNVPSGTPSSPQRAPASSTRLPTNAPYRPIAAPGIRPSLTAPTSTRVAIAKPAANPAPSGAKLPPTTAPDSEQPRPSRRPPPPLPSQVSKKDS